MGYYNTANTIRWVPIVKYTGVGELGFTYDTNIVNKQW